MAAHACGRRLPHRSGPGQRPGEGRQDQGDGGVDVVASQVAAPGGGEVALHGVAHRCHPFSQGLSGDAELEPGPGQRRGRLQPQEHRSGRPQGEDRLGDLPVVGRGRGQVGGRVRDCQEPGGGALQGCAQAVAQIGGGRAVGQEPARGPQEPSGAVGLGGAVVRHAAAAGVAGLEAAVGPLPGGQVAQNAQRLIGQVHGTEGGRGEGGVPGPDVAPDAHGRRHDRARREDLGPRRQGFT